MKKLKCSVLNAFNDGEHPYADLEIVDYFDTEYTLERIDMAINYTSISGLVDMLKKLKIIEESA